MEWKNKIWQPRFRKVLCLILSVLVLVSLLAPGSALKPMEQTDPLAQQQIRDITPVRLGDEADSSNVIIVPVEGNEDAETSVDVAEGDGIAGEGNAQTGETQPQELLPVEVEGDKIDQEQTGTGSGDQGQEAGSSGEEGGEQIQPDLAAVLEWKRDGSDTTVVCAPYQTVATTVNMAQLKDGLLNYRFYLTGKSVGDMEITSVTYSSGNDLPQKGNVQGQMELSIPEGEDSRTWFFWLEAQGKNADGEEMTVTFTYVLKCENRLDLNLVLEWEKPDGSKQSITCRADGTANRTVDSGELEGGAFPYTIKLTGSKAGSANLISGKYTTLSGQTGTLEVNGGTLQLTTPEGVDAQIYDLFFEAKLGDRIVSYKISIHYRDVLSVRLNVTWYAGDTVPSSKICQSGDTVEYTIRTGEVRNGSARFTLEPEGEDAQGADFLAVSYQGSDGSGGVLSSSQGNSKTFSFQLPVSLGSGGANTYTITVLMLAEGKNLTYTIQIRYASDMTLEMIYTLADGTQQQIRCENGDEVEAEAIGEDRLEEGLLNYIMTARNAEGNIVPIDKIFCYHSGNQRNEGPLQPEGSVTLLLKNGKIGENTFEVTVKEEDREYTFKINIPFEPRGTKTVHFWTSLEDGDDVINDQVNNFSVRAWVENEDGTTHYIRNGNGEKLTVRMNDEPVPATTHAGSTMEYDLIPPNPVSGDTNSHTILIEAKDESGNHGTLELTLRGNRRMPGQVLGKATIRVDLAVLGKGIESVEYTVLSNEPASVSIAKAVWGYDYGEPFGAAEKTLGWSDGAYSGTLEEGFYLSRLHYGGSVGAIALEGDSWTYPLGSGNEELQYEIIDNYFGKRKDLTALWRCIYRNDVEKSEGAEDIVGEFLYTLGAGWTCFLNDSSFPGEGLDQCYLRDGDVLTLAYTLAYGWDVGNGREEFGSGAGYCVQAKDGKLEVDHHWNACGSYNECSHCGLKTYCKHEKTIFREVDEHYHEKICADPNCGLTVDSDLPHIWSDDSATDPSGHSCKDCDYTHEHSIHTESDDAYCDKAGRVTESCWDCPYSYTEEIQKDHHFGGDDPDDDDYEYDNDGHWLFCNLTKSDGSECNEPGPRESHNYEYHGYQDGLQIWMCSDCSAIHGLETCEDSTFMEPEDSDDTGSSFHCGTCGWDFRANHAWSESGSVQPTCTEMGLEICEYCFYEMEIPETGHDFVEGSCGICGEADPDYHEHTYEEGVCTGCGESDPDYVPPEDDEEPEGPDEDLGGSDEEPEDPGEEGGESGEEAVSLFARLLGRLPGRTIWEERI